MSEAMSVRLFNESRHAEGRDRSLYEIHYRVPRKISSPFMATHMALVAKTPEDRYYDFISGKVKETFTQTDFRALATFRRERADWRQLIEEFNKDYDKTGVRITVPDTDLMARIDKIRNAAIDAYATVLDSHTVTFIFGAPAQILRRLGREVTDILGRDPIADIVFRHLGMEFETYFRAKIEQIYAGPGSESNKPFVRQFSSQDFGGTRAWLEKDYTEKKEHNIGRNYDDFRDLIIKSKSDEEDIRDNINHRVRWSRNPQDWGYTFIETIKQDRLELINDDILIGFILTSAFEPNVMAATAFKELSPEYDFPGYLLAGAHYLLLPVELLLRFTASDPTRIGFRTIDDILTRVERLRSNTVVDSAGKVIDYRARARNLEDSMRKKHPVRAKAVSQLLSRCLELADTGSLLSVLHHSLEESSARKAIEITILRDSEDKSTARWAHVAEELIRPLTSAEPDGSDRERCQFFASLVINASNNLKVKKADRLAVLGLLAQTIQTLWESAFTMKIEEDVRDVADDYVCSSMIDGRCVYFSNFMPVGEEKFTRTIFVDLGMTPYQRARVLSRLCDILTYRSVPIRDMDRVKAAIEALNEFNRTLNDIQMQFTKDSSDNLATSQVTGKPRETVPPLQGLMDRLHEELSEILRVSAQAGRVNSFVTYGIAGKWYSARAYINQIRERYEDLREQRIPDYARLTDFVERRLAHAIRFVERMFMHHRTVGQRVTELMDRVRTQLNALQTRQIVDHLSAQVDTAKSLQDASVTLQRATTDIKSSLDKQVALAMAAESVVVLGGSYYAYQLLNAAMTFLPPTDRPGGTRLVAIAIPLALFVRLSAGPLIRCLERIKRWVLLAYQSLKSQVVGLFRRRPV